LFDLVRCKDDKLRLAFWFALGNALVANNLDQASRIAYNKQRDARFGKVVTLAGQLIADSGAMTGGGGRPRGGRMRTGSAAPTGVAADAKAAEKELGLAERQMGELEQQLKVARDQRCGSWGCRHGEQYAYEYICNVFLLMTIVSRLLDVKPGLVDNHQFGSCNAS
jgi:structural maintenance of chromosome 4